jgi:hypothetical protein
MATSAARKKTRQTNKALYAPRPKPPAESARPKMPERHLVGDEALKKIIQRVLGELKLPGKIPSEVIFSALAEVRDLVEQASKRP